MSSFQPYLVYGFFSCNKSAFWSVISFMPRKYSKKASKYVKKEMHEAKRGRAHSGRGGPKVKSRKQAIAIGLSKARKAGAKVPPPPRK